MVKNPETSYRRGRDDWRDQGSSTDEEDDPNFEVFKGEDRRNLRPRHLRGRRDSDDSSRRTSQRTTRTTNKMMEVSEISESESDEDDDEASASNHNSDEEETAEEQITDGAGNVGNDKEEVGTRRSLRKRKLRSYSSKSWILADTNTQPRRSRRTSTQEPDNSPRAESRRSTRSREDEHTKEENGSVLPSEQENAAESSKAVESDEKTTRRLVTTKMDIEEYSEAERTEDMYSRLKTRSSRRAERVDYREFIRTTTRNARGQDEEPVSKRLRERKSKQQDARPSMGAILAKARNHRRKQRRRSTSSRSRSSSDSSRGDRRNNHSHHNSFDKAEKVGSKKGFLDLQPNEVDPSITFASVGGLEYVVEKLRETVILPLVYKEFYSARNIIPPKGILFHGPPGTGKTLLARALVNECSTLAGQKVTFFVRKGGDIMSKWVGESERQLRSLFEQASRCQPSIIFFDEIDGLAPVRSAKTDQIHNSVVSTLLAELDGIKNRGDVIIIGATNRVDSIDSALRRPGSGADLKLLCAEASVCGMRRRYPQIYTSTNKYLLDYNSIKVEQSDWLQAMKKIKPSSMRAVNSIITTGHPLPTPVVPLLSNEVEQIEKNITNLFPLTEVTDLLHEPAPKRFLIYACHEDSGLDHYVLPSLLHRFESVPVFTLNFETIILRDPASEIGAISLVFNEAERINKLAIVLIPSANVIFEGMTKQGQDFLYHKIVTSSSKPIFVLATAELEKTRSVNVGSADSEDDGDSLDLPDSLLNLFIGRSHSMNLFSRNTRNAFFKEILSGKALMFRNKIEFDVIKLQELQLAPPAPPKLPSPEELKKIEKKETTMLRSLRKFLREVIWKLARNKKFNIFLTPVDPVEVPDYLHIIKRPMDFESMMRNLDQGLYLSAQDFMADIHLIRDNAVEYNPPETVESKAIIHRAHELVDYAWLILEDEMDSDFEDACRSIAVARKEREEAAASHKDHGSELESVPGCSKELASLTPKPLCNGFQESSSENDININGKRKLRQGATINGTKLRKVSPSSDNSPSCSTSPGSSDSRTQNGLKTPEVGRGKTPDSNLVGQDHSQDGFCYTKCVNYDDCDKKMKKLLHDITDSTEGIGVNRILDIRYQLMLVIERNYSSTDKTRMMSHLRKVIDSYVESRKQLREKSSALGRRSRFPITEALPRLIKQPEEF
ncbi:unnamed protein product [Allacma fusca]|uniref:Bromo domain-containing protein n=1 Tax=Allacma fusca TaxID=39272 RepID=A0A8J2PR89_9HEXA|nr:unnamed protein product [Allacma fusca]